MHDDADAPAAVPAPPIGQPASPGRLRAVLCLGAGAGVGLAVGVLLTVGVTATQSLFAPSILPTRDMVQVFHELNELRQQINRLNEERTLKDQENLAAIREALSTVAATARPQDIGAPGTASIARSQGGSPEKPPVGRAWDPLAEVDEEIKRLENTQKVLNTILDLFTLKAKDRPKDRPAAKTPPD